jgi:hypothetical protein
MMQLSDNAATSALIHHVEHDRIMARLAALGLPHTTIGPEDVIADIERITATLDRLAQQVGFAAWQEPASTVRPVATRRSADRLMPFVCVQP